MSEDDDIKIECDSHGATAKWGLICAHAHDAGSLCQGKTRSGKWVVVCVACDAALLSGDAERRNAALQHIRVACCDCMNALWQRQVH